MPDTSAMPNEHNQLLKRGGGEATDKDSTGRNISTMSSQVPKKNTGRGGYDWPFTSKTGYRSGHEDTVPKEILHALRIPPDHVIDKGFIIPGVGTDPGASLESLRNTATAAVDYTLIGDPFKRDPTLDGASSFFLRLNSST